jgi:SAM-dependent methyltransferase
MREEILELVCCPSCKGTLDVTAEELLDKEIWRGIITCTKCGNLYAINRGIPHLYLEDELWKSKAQEANGWIDLHNEQGGYAIDTNDVNLPYYPDAIWKSIATHFDVALERLNLTGKEVVLDLGAGRGWAAKHFSKYGCTTVAVDILADEQIGLGRAWALMQHENVYFSPVIADGERLPFLPEQVDIVFCSAALHHTSDLRRLLQNIHRILKPGGRFCAINEPVVSIFENEDDVLNRDAEDELKHGINENRPNLCDYYTTLQVIGFGNLNTWRITTLNTPTVQLLQWAKDIGIVRPTVHWRDWQTALSYWRRFIYLNLRSLPKRSAIKSLLGDSERENLIRLLALYVSGDLCFIAEKLR